MDQSEERKPKEQESPAPGENSEPVAERRPDPSSETRDVEGRTQYVGMEGSEAPPAMDKDGRGTRDGEAAEKATMAEVTRPASGLASALWWLLVPLALMAATQLMREVDSLSAPVATNIIRVLYLAAAWGSLRLLLGLHRLWSWRSLKELRLRISPPEPRRGARIRFSLVRGEEHLPHRSLRVRLRAEESLIGGMEPSTTVRGRLFYEQTEDHTAKTSGEETEEVETLKLKLPAELPIPRPQGETLYWFAECRVNLGLLRWIRFRVRYC